MDNYLGIEKNTSVLITGSTGFTGSWLLRKLVKAGLKVKAIVRSNSNIAQFKGLDVEWITGNIFEKETVEKAVKNTKYIFNVAAAYREAKLKKEDYYQVHVIGTKLLAKEAIKQAEFKRFVHISTIGVHGDIKTPPADENSPFRPGDIYQETKAEAEKWLHKFAKESSLEYTVIRPVAIYGPNDKRLFKLFKMVNNGFFPILGFGKTLYHLIHVDDLTNIIMLAATHENAKNESFIAGNEITTSIKEIALIIAEAYNKKLNIWRFPAWPFFILGFLCEIICRPLKIEPPIYRRRVAFYTKDRSFNTDKLQTLLGYKTIYSNKQGIIETAKWYRSEKWI